VLLLGRGAAWLDGDTMRGLTPQQSASEADTMRGYIIQAGAAILATGAFSPSSPAQPPPPSPGPPPARSPAPPSPAAAPPAPPPFLPHHHRPLNRTGSCDGLAGTRRQELAEPGRGATAPTGAGKQPATARGRRPGENPVPRDAHRDRKHAPAPRVTARALSHGEIRPRCSGAAVPRTSTGPRRPSSTPGRGRGQREPAGSHPERWLFGQATPGPQPTLRTQTPTEKKTRSHVRKKSTSTT